MKQKRKFKRKKGRKNFIFFMQSDESESYTYEDLLEKYNFDEQEDVYEFFDLAIELGLSSFKQKYDLEIFPYFNKKKEVMNLRSLHANIKSELENENSHLRKFNQNDDKWLAFSIAFIRDPMQVKNIFEDIFEIKVDLDFVHNNNTLYYPLRHYLQNFNLEKSDEKRGYAFELFDKMFKDS